MLGIKIKVDEKTEGVVFMPTPTVSLPHPLSEEELRATLQAFPFEALFKAFPASKNITIFMSVIDREHEIEEG